MKKMIQEKRNMNHEERKLMSSPLMYDIWICDGLPSYSIALRWLCDNRRSSYIRYKVTFK